MTGRAGDPAGARDQFAALLPAREGSGPEHPDTLAVRGNLAAWTGVAGDPAGARDQYAALLPVHERVLGGEHPDTLWTRHNLARWTGQAGDPAGARDQFAALLPEVERVLGPEHPDILAARGNLARWTGQAGDAAGARDQYAALLPIRSGCSALSTRTPWPPGVTWPAGLGRPGIRPGPATSSPRCFLWSADPGRRTPGHPGSGTTSPTRPAGRELAGLGAK